MNASSGRIIRSGRGRLRREVDRRAVAEERLDSTEASWGEVWRTRRRMRVGATTQWKMRDNVVKETKMRKDDGVK